MQVSRFPCPQCTVGLRIRDRSFIGKEIHCPECGSRLEIVADGAKKLTARLIVTDTASPQSPKTKPHRKKPSFRRKPAAASAPTRSFLAVVAGALKSPVVICWIVAGIAAVTLAAVAINREANRENDTVTATEVKSMEPAILEGQPEAIKRAPLPAQPVVARKPNFIPPVINEDVNPPIIVGRSPVEARRPLPIPAVPPIPPKPKVDVAAALAQPILLFEHSKGTPLKTLLGELEEMAGVPLAIDPTVETGPTSPLNQSVVIRVEKTTVGGVLIAALAQTGLTFAAEKERIRIVSATAKTQVEAQAIP